MGDLKFKIKDFGSINKANIKMKKINIVSGINGSGKSTASKILYSFLISMSQEGIKFQNNKISSYLYEFERFIKFGLDDSSEDLRLKIRDVRRSISNMDFSENDDLINIFEEIKNKNYTNSSKNFENSIAEIEKILDVQDNLEKRRSLIFNDIIFNEFNNDIVYNENTSLSLVNEKGSFSMGFTTNRPKIQYKKMNFLVNEIFYIETPFIFDFFRNSHLVKPFYNDDFLFHQNSLMERLSGSSFDKNFSNKIFDSQFQNPAVEIIDKIMCGNIKFDRKIRKFTYKKSEDEEYNIKNTAAGIKTIGILQGLLNNGLDTNSFIIMDEPEVHLHPSWQISLAEAIVLLSKHENISFYINSHSPHFIEAIEVYTEKYGLNNETSFYITQKNEIDSDKYDFIEVDRKELKILYRYLSDSYDIIDKVRGKIFAKEI
jgi:ABC-type cobalamin/Fe3+-siderophores transport system ATPase subunit